LGWVSQSDNPPMQSLTRDKFIIKLGWKLIRLNLDNLAG
jgi:very-short-patch-repair endonuclease